MISIRVTELADLEALATGITEFETHMGLVTEEGGVLPPEFIARYLEKFRKHPDWLGVCAIENERIIGSGLFKSSLIDGTVEIGYGVAPSAEGRGVATRMARAMVRYAFAKGARSVFAHTLPESLASQRVLEKSGMHYDGLVVEDEKVLHRYVIVR